MSSRRGADPAAPETPAPTGVSGPGGVDETARRLAAHIARAGAWRQSGDYRRAGLLLSLTLGAAEARYGPDSLPVALAHHELGMLGRYTGAFAAAALHYGRALAIFEAVGGPDHDAVATVYHNLGGLAYAAGRYTEAEEPARRAVELRTRQHGPDHPRVAADRAAWAAVLDGCGRSAEAQIQLSRALTVLAVAYPEGHLDLASARHNLAALAHRRRDLPTAVDGYTTALREKENLLGPRHPELATTLVGLGAALQDIARPDDARACYTRAIDLLTGTVADDHPVLVAAQAAYTSIASHRHP